MNLYATLKLEQSTTKFSSSSEAVFFYEHSYLLSGSDSLSRYDKPATPFDIVRGNIIIRSLLNKTAIEKLYREKARELKETPKEESTSLTEYMDSAMSEFPYLLYGGKKIYVPLFPSSLNSLYSNRFEKLFEPPYKRLLTSFEAAIIDPFDYYGFSLYDSYFTKFVIVRKTPKCLACYDYDAEALYFINDEGRLDASVALFDKGIKNPTKTHMVKRIEKVSDFYLKDDRLGFMRSLVENGLISSALMRKIAGRDFSSEKSGHKKKEGKL